MKYSSIGIVFFILVNNIYVINSYALNTSSSTSNLQLLKESVIALDSTKVKSQQKQSQLNNQSNPTLYKEYSVFIDYLSFRINTDCEKIIKHYGQSQVEQLPCRVKTYLLDDKNYVTAEEATMGLEDELMQALGEFDEMLLKEEEMIAQTSAKSSSNQSSGGFSGAMNSGNSETRSPSEQTQGNSTENSEYGKKSESESDTEKNEISGKNSNAEKKQSGKGYGKKSAKNSKRIKLDKIDDDIVARQLKEAAETEKDPELKEKLWDEYYRYKQNTIK